jgi:hypothetical protein
MAVIVGEAGNLVGMAAGALTAGREVEVGSGWPALMIGAAVSVAACGSPPIKEHPIVAAKTNKSKSRVIDLGCRCE